MTLSSLVRDLTAQDKRKIATIVLTMTIGLPVYTVFMSLTGIIDVPITTSLIGVTFGIGVVFSLVVMIPAYLFGNTITS